MANVLVIKLFDKNCNWVAESPIIADHDLTREELFDFVMQEINRDLDKVLRKGFKISIYTEERKQKYEEK